MVTEPVSELTKHDMLYVLNRLPQHVFDMIHEHKLFLAGGFIRAVISGEKPSDIDLFGEDKGYLKEVAEHFCKGYHGRFFETDNAYTVFGVGVHPVQFIHRWMYPFDSDGVKALLNQFDFTIAKSVMWHSDGGWHSLVDDRFYPDLAAKRLYYTFPDRNEDAGGSMLRVIKFIKKGYSIQVDSLASVMARVISGTHITDEEEFVICKKVLGLLREIDPLVNGRFNEVEV